MLKIENLAKAYGDRTIFKNLNLTLPAGEVLAIVGPSGIGKTTFLKIIAGLLPADAGQMILDDQPLDLSGYRKDARVGVIFQDFNLFPQYSVLKNVTLAPQTVKHLRPQNAQALGEQLLSELGLAAQMNQYPFQLSGGQKQRVAIARALAMQPGMLAYDEPTSGLDAESTQRVIDVILQLKEQGTTQLVVTHDLSFAKAIADRTLDFGNEVERG
ncbi:amino acid ABC transporter ATP-binding protein [Weissella kandleri]|uniref:amino acid ABC transporter ATP-binding protein n=1 Tax=Weissella kandleri TaxID=1616 RepID=UPI00387E4F65